MGIKRLPRLNAEQEDKRLTPHRIERNMQRGVQNYIYGVRRTFSKLFAADFLKWRGVIPILYNFGIIQVFCQATEAICIPAYFILCYPLGPIIYSPWHIACHIGGVGFRYVFLAWRGRAEHSYDLLMQLIWPFGTL